MRTSSPLKGPVKSVASTTLLINFFYGKPCAVAQHYLVDISQTYWHADFQLQYLLIPGKSSEFKKFCGIKDALSASTTLSSDL